MRMIYLLLAAFLFIGCMGTAPVTGREQVLLMSPSEEKALGDSSYKDFLSKSKNKYR